MFIILFLFIINNIVKYSSSFFLNYSEGIVKKKISNVINNSITNDFLEYIKDKDIYKIIRNSKNEIEMIDYNTYYVNDFLERVTKKVQDDVNNIDNNSDFIKVPIFAIFNNVFTNDFGPNISVRLKSVGSVETNVVTNIKEYGINNSFIDMGISVSIKEKIILPVMSKIVSISTVIPLSYKIIKGNIPYYYNTSGITKSSGIVSLPIE